MMPYWRTLGEFVDNFARTEVALKIFLIKLLRLEDGVGRVVTAGLRADTLATYVIRINDLSPLPGTDEQFVKEAVEHFSGINTVRNAILHTGAFSIAEEGVLITNTFTARTSAHVHQFHIKPESIQAMADDLVKLMAHLALYLVSPELAATARPACQPFLDRAWRSRPHELMNRSPGNQQGSRK
jgi:hypothetical protein